MAWILGNAYMIWYFLKVYPDPAVPPKDTEDAVAHAFFVFPAFVTLTVDVIWVLREILGDSVHNAWVAAPVVSATCIFCWLFAYGKFKRKEESSGSL